jgi:hypothetical protein
MIRLIIGVAVFTMAVVAWRSWRRSQQRRNIASAIDHFVRNRINLQEDFRAAANITGKPRGLIWKSCEFQEGLQLAYDRGTGELVGLMPVTISFEAVAGGDMEDVEAVSNLRAATAVFTWTDHEWTTQGRAVFNLEPREVLQKFASTLAPIVA